MSGAALSVGEPLPVQQYVVRRVDLVRYAGASGDFNPIHWSDRVARLAGLPGVVAHGMLTLGLAARAVAVWTDDAEVVEIGGRFVNPVVVPDDEDGVSLEVGGTVRSAADDVVTIGLTVTCGGQRVLGNPRAVVRTGDG